MVTCSAMEEGGWWDEVVEFLGVPNFETVVKITYCIDFLTNK